VHSNGAIYIRGGEASGFQQRNWHQMASGDWNVDDTGQDGYGNPFQSVLIGGRIGDANNGGPVAITGVEGLFRMSKTANCLARNSGLQVQIGGTTGPMPGLRNDPNIPDPRQVPLTTGDFISDNFGGGSRLDLNGDSIGSRRHHLNGVPFDRGNDSRSPAAMISAFSNRVRDKGNGGNFVRTLQNIPELGGRPFESQSVVYTVVGAKSQVYRDPLDPTYLSRFPTRLVGAATRSLRPLAYASDPTSSAGILDRARPYRTMTAVQEVATGAPMPAGSRMVEAEDLTLWWDPLFQRRDIVHPSEDIALTDQIPGLPCDCLLYTSPSPRDH
jgi:hypothetical protein